MRAELGSTEKGTKPRTGLVVGRDEKDFLTLSFDAKGGFMRIGNPAGEGVAGMASDDLGGEVSVTGPQGGMVVGSLAARPGGAALSLFDSAGKARANMTATDVGDFGLYSDTGWLNMNSGKDAPRFQIMDAAGTIMVQAGVAVSNVGLVQVGPAGNGAASTLGNMGLAASQIIGKKE
jgi:hypothetical protein